MTFAEIVLRIGSAIGGWLIFTALGLTLAVLPQSDCDPGSQELWRGTLLFGLAGAAGLCFVGRGLAWREALRWLALPAAALSLYAGVGILPALATTTVGAESLCGITAREAPLPVAFEAGAVERIWPVVQLAVLAFGLVQAHRYWRRRPDAVAGAPLR